MPRRRDLRAVAWSRWRTRQPRDRVHSFPVAAEAVLQLAPHQVDGAQGRVKRRRYKGVQFVDVLTAGHEEEGGTRVWRRDGKNRSVCLRDGREGQTGEGNVQLTTPVGVV